MDKPTLKVKSENLLEKLNIEFAIQEDYVDAILDAVSPQDLFDNERHMTNHDFEVIREEAGKWNGEGDFDIEHMMEDFKCGILFIEFMYAQIYHNDRTIEERAEQIRGSKAMYFNGYFKGNMLGEYPTGSGKSFMYLIFAAAAYHIRGEMTTIVTSGISLQEQLDAKDMPFISNIYEELTKAPLRYGLLKGRQNYVCNLRYNNIKEVVFAGHKVAGIKDTEALKNYLKSIPKKFNGDMSNIEITPEPETRRALTVKDNRSGGCKKCELRKECFYLKSKLNVMGSAVKVINYHLLFTECEKIRKIGHFGGLSQNYVFDEAHEIASIGRDFTEKVFNKASLTGLKGMLTSVDNRIADTQSAASPLWGDVKTPDIERWIGSAESDFAYKAPGWHVSIKDKYYDEAIVKPDRHIDTTSLMLTLREIRDHIVDASDDKLLALGFEELGHLYAANEQSDGEFDEALAIFEGIESAADAVSEMLVTLSYFQEGSLTRKAHPDDIIWIAKDQEDRYALRVKCTQVNILQKAIFSDRFFSSVSVSATLSTNETFKFYKKETMLEDTSFEIVGPSPFDLEKQELWYMPKNAKVASRATPEDEYMGLVVDNITEVLEISNGGMLALFTSYKAMRAAYAEIIRRFPHLNIYLQGEKPRKHLVDLFRNDVNSVLFATRSFFTGIDIKGPSLRVLVLDKLPFDNPSDPVVRTLSNQPNGFRFYSIPSMVMILKQIFGRGVRSKRDKCLIMIMDKRLKTSNYAGMIRKSFDAGGNSPGSTHDIERVQKFLGDFMDEYGEETFKSSRRIDNLDFLAK